MTNLQIRAAVASAIALSAGQAFALNSGSITGTEVKLYVGGATATDNAFTNLFKLTTANGGLCTDGTLDVYFYSGSAGGTTNQRLFFCTGNANSGVSGQKIAVFKESQGGSAEGVSPVADPTILRNFLPFSAATLGACEAASSVLSAASGNFAQYTLHSCNSSTITLNSSGVANAGISDIDPKTFVGLGPVIAAHANSLTSTSTVGVTFNPIVSVPLYEALQTAQGLSTGSETLANMPSVTLSQLRAIFGGRINNANQLYAYNNSTSSTAQLSSGTLYVCRRGNSSGTMSSFKILFLGEGCSKNADSIASFVLPSQVYTGEVQDPDTDEWSGTGPVNQVDVGQPWSTSATLYTGTGTGAIAGGYGGIRVFAGSGSGDVRSCMGYHSDNSHYAVGTASTESLPAEGVGTASNTHWRYVRIDGVEPTLKATMEGRYPYFTENTMNRQSNASKSNYLATGSNLLALFNGIAGQIGKTNVLLAVNNSWKDAAAIGTVGAGEGDTGILDIPATGNNLSALPVTAASVRVKPVNGQKRNVTGSANNCNFSLQAYP